MQPSNCLARLVHGFLLVAMAAPTHAALVVFSAGGAIDTSATVSYRFDPPVSDDPSQVDWDLTDLPFDQTQTASASGTGGNATATASQAIRFDSTSIQGSAAVSIEVEADSLSTASASARSQFTIRFDITDNPAPYTFTGTLADFPPSNVVAPFESNLFIKQQGGPFSNSVSVSGASEPFSFSGVLQPGRYELSIVGVFTDLTELATSFGGPSLSRTGSVDFELQVVPVPGAAGLFLSALGVFGLLRRYAT